MAKEERKLVSFDWALKYLLKSEKELEVVSGFLSELLGEDITVKSVIDGETIKTTAAEKQNRVDLLAQIATGEQVIIEFQYGHENDYIDRIMHGASKVVAQSLKQGQYYVYATKVISVSIVFCNIGAGKDYIYKYEGNFVGRHFDDTLGFSKGELEHHAKHHTRKIERPEDLFPVYYILRVNKFDKRIRDKFDEWMYFLKTECVKGELDAKGLDKASEILDTLKLNGEQRRDYERHRNNVSHYTSAIQTAKEEGAAKGEAKEKIAAVVRMHQAKSEKSLIATATGLTLAEIDKILASLC